MLFLAIIIALFEVSCGELNQTVLIVGGHDANIEDHPFQLSFEVNGKHDCGASILKPNIALTAAHCLDTSKDFIKLRAGSTWTEKDGQVTAVHTICKHPKYNSVTKDYDVAVMLLDTSLILGSGIATIPLQPMNGEIQDGVMGTVSGWGDLSETGPPALHLQAVDIPKMNRKKCKQDYPNKITDRMFCFGYSDGKMDACVGDSGGPIVVHGKQAGITSWGVRCAQPGKPGVYVKIAHPEIHGFINKCVNHFESPVKKVSSGIILE